jgi:DNA-binding transcriptional MerR regulator
MTKFAFGILFSDGMALAAIQGLNQKLEVRSQRSEVRIQELEAQNAELKARLAALERIVLNLSAKGD